MTSHPLHTHDTNKGFKDTVTAKRASLQLFVAVLLSSPDALYQAAVST
jgi:hypothetical protein